MANPEKRLTARGVAAAGDGRHADGGGLYLEVSGARRSWIWRYRFGDKRRDMGLGAASEVTLAEARAARDKWRAVLRNGRDPVDSRSRREDGVLRGTTPTFGSVADAFIADHEATWRNPKHIAQWKMTLEKYAFSLRVLPVDKITTEDVLAVLRPFWQSRPETGSRLRGRIEMVIDAAHARGHIANGLANPARWKGHLDKILPKAKKLVRGHHAAMPFADVPGFCSKLRATDSVAARALEFAILTASRTSEVLGAVWGEIDSEKKVWHVPASRMKAGRDHRVPLSARVIEIVEAMRTLNAAFGSEKKSEAAFVFPGARPRRPLSNMAFTMLLRRAGFSVTAHGFRSSFRDWAGEATSFPREIAEAALAHQVGDETERAYRRGDALERRRAMMDEWAVFVCAPSVAKVVKFRRSSTAP